MMTSKSTISLLLYHKNIPKKVKFMKNLIFVKQKCMRMNWDSSPNLLIGRFVDDLLFLKSWLFESFSFWHAKVSLGKMLNLELLLVS